MGNVFRRVLSPSNLAICDDPRLQKAKRRVHPNFRQPVACILISFGSGSMDPNILIAPPALAPVSFIKYLEN
jgi:hypothetical protein